LLLVDVVLAIPIAFALRTQRRALMVLGAILIAAMLVARTSFLVRFAGAFDRTSILEASYFEEAERVRAADPQAFVLVEPRVSSDLYAGNQSFFDARMLPTRHMVLQKRDPAFGVYGVVARLPEFIEGGDLAHLWLMRPIREPKWQWLGSIPYVAKYLPRPSYRTTWHAERLADSRRPVVIFSGDLYERTYERTTGTAAPPGFATIRNGSVSVFVPPNAPGELSLEVRPAAAVEPGADAKITPSGDASKLEYALPAAPTAAFRVVARCKAECQVRVRLDGKDTD